MNLVFHGAKHFYPRTASAAGAFWDNFPGPYSLGQSLGSGAKKAGEQGATVLGQTLDKTSERLFGGSIALALGALLALIVLGTGIYFLTRKKK